LLQVKKEPLPAEPWAVAAQGAVGGDDPVAGNYNGHRVGAVGLAHGASPERGADAAGNVGIAAHCAVGDGQQRAPHPLLEWRATQSQRKLKLATLPLEVLLELARRFADERVPGVFDPARLAMAHVELDHQNGCVVSDDAQPKVGVRLNDSVTGHIPCSS
jgi:hypothetical protein